MDKRDGGPAFPRPLDGQVGMRLRDWFAGQALAGMLGNESAFENEDRAAEWAYEFADAMLAAREADDATP